METNLLTPAEMKQMQANFTIKVHTFKGLNQQQRKDKFEQVENAWNQFTEVCQGEVEPSHIASFAEALQGQGHGELHCDYMIVISCKKYVLGYALAAEESILYDAPTLNLLRQPPYNNIFDTDKTFHIKLLCSRPNSGIGTQLVRVCGNLAIRLKCASIRLEAVPTAHGFYKSVGLVPFLDAKFACSPARTNSDANKFEDAIVAMARSFETSEGGADAFSPARLQGKYNSYMNKASEARRAVLSGVIKSRIVEPTRVHKWATQKTKLDRELKHIVETVFTTDSVHSETIPMSKCLLQKANSGHDSDSDSTIPERNNGSDSDSTIPQMTEAPSGSESCLSGDTSDTQIDPGCAVQANSAQGSGASDQSDQSDLLDSDDDMSDDDGPF